MNANQADAQVRTMCRVLRVSASGCCAWRDRLPSARSVANAVLCERIRQVHAESHQTYGMPRVRAELIDQGLLVSRKRVAALMRQHGIRGISRRRSFTVTTRRDARQRPASDLVFAALNMALQQRKPNEVIHHSDQGSQGEFNQSLQHVLTGGVDEAEEVEGGSITEGEDAITGQAASVASC